MIETNAVIAILEREDALNLVRLDHRLQYVLDRKRLLPRASQVVRESQDPAEIVRRMAPLGGEPGIVEIQPADHRTDIEGSVHGLELPVGAGDARAVRQGWPGNSWPERDRRSGNGGR